jgi:hypothetical protein
MPGKRAVYITAQLYTKKVHNTPRGHDAVMAKSKAMTKPDSTTNYCIDVFYI